MRWDPAGVCMPLWEVLVRHLADEELEGVELARALLPDGPEQGEAPLADQLREFSGRGVVHALGAPREGRDGRIDRHAGERRSRNSGFSRSSPFLGTNEPRAPNIRR